MKYPFGLLSAIFLLWCVATPVIAQSPPGFPHDLDSESPVRAAQAVKHLQQLDRSSIGELANSLEADLSPRTRAYLESKLDSLLRGILEEFDTLGSELEELRKSPVSDETAVEKSLSRARIRNKFDSLLEIARTGGPFLATSLVWHSEIRDSSSELLKRMRSRIRTEILRSWSENHPGRDAASLTRSELRWLSVLSQKPISTVPEAFWQTVLERSCAEAWSDLCSFDPVRERRGRRYFLDIGPAAHDYFDSVLRNQKDGDPPTELIHEWRMRTLLRMPPEWDYSHAVSLADWKHKSGADRIEILLRLKAILGSKITPTLYHVATTATDPILRRRSAEFLSLLGDSRGAKILLTERRFGAHRLEAASRDAILRAATTLRDSKNLEGARLLLEELVERLPHDASARHSLGLVLLRERNLEPAIHQFQRSIALDPTRATTHYNLACALALDGQVEKALDSLAESIRQGYDRFDHARNDPDLMTLREDPRFQELFPDSN